MKGRLRVCAVCQRSSAFVSDDGICDKCEKQVPPSIHFRRKGNDMMPVTVNGYVLTPSKWYDLKRQIERFYYKHSFEEIDALNEETRKQKERRTIQAPVTKNGAIEPKDGYVYVIRSEVGHYKIGQTVNLEKRLQSLQGSRSDILTIVHTIKCRDVMKLEKYLHLKFDYSRLRGEWFDLSNEQLDWLFSLTEESAELLLNDLSNSNHN